MVLGPGILGAKRTVILRVGEKLPAHMNALGVLVYEEQPDRSWKLVKDSVDFLPGDQLEFTEVKPLDKEVT